MTKNQGHNESLKNLPRGLKNCPFSIWGIKNATMLTAAAERLRVIKVLWLRGAAAC